MVWGFVVFFILGLVFGSFANVLIYRIPRNESIVFPGSHCPVCGHPLSWKDNIPLLSYIFLKGKCRYCGAKISPRYPIVEFSMGLLFVLGFAIYGLSVQLLFVLTAYFLLFVISWIDFEHGVVPDSLTFAGVAIGLLGHFLFDRNGLLLSFSGLALALVLGFLIRILGRLAFKREAFGEGDITTLSAVGALLGPDYVLVGLFLGSILGLIFVILVLVLRKKVSETVKFCPFIALSVLIYSIVAPYHNLFYVF